MKGIAEIEALMANQVLVLQVRICSNTEVRVAMMRCALPIPN